MGHTVYVHDPGGRGHAYAWKFSQSHDVDKVFVLGVPGINEYTPEGRRGEIEAVPHLRNKPFSDVTDFCREKRVDFVTVGAEDPLEQGLADEFREAGILALGPTKEQARLEGDRPYANRFLDRIYRKHRWRAFNPSFGDSEELVREAMQYVGEIGEVVVKAGGTYAGKGCIECNTSGEAEKVLRRILVDREFATDKKTGKIVKPNNSIAVVEGKLYGTELSAFAYVSGEISLLVDGFVQDYKARFDPDDQRGMFDFRFGRDIRELRKYLQGHGIEIPQNLKQMSDDERASYVIRMIDEREIELPNPNTGGMGSYIPHGLMDRGLFMRIEGEIAEPFAHILEGENIGYRGIIYYGLMYTSEGKLNVLETNVRPGDPEWEVLLPKLKTDLFHIEHATARGRLFELKRSLDGGLEWDDNYYVNVVAVAGPTKSRRGGNTKGYPGRYEQKYLIKRKSKGRPITLKDFEEFNERGIMVFLAGTTLGSDGELLTEGGRVLNVVAPGRDLEEATNLAYETVEDLEFINSVNGDNCLRYRKKIGAREIQSV